jgi:hypothetical protein
MYRQVVAAVAKGAPYYETLGAALRRGNYATVPMWNWRPPLVYTMLAHLPEHAEWLFVPLMVSMLVIAGPRVSDAGRLTMSLGIVSVLAVLIGSGASWMTESWAGVAIGLSLVCHLRGARLAAVLLAGLACALRELAVVYLAICAVAAWRERRSDELRTMVGVAVALALYYGGHWWAVRHAQRPTDLTGASWLAGGGMAFVRDTLYHTYFGERVRVLLAWSIGLSTLATSMPVRLRWTVWAYACAFLIVGRPDNSYWGLMVNPAHAIALGFLPETIQQGLWRRDRANDASRK